jgi:hypothetical protein
MSLSFLQTIAAYSQAREGNTFELNQIPLSPSREGLREGAGSRTIINWWAASVTEQAHELRQLIWMHDNGGTASSPKKIKRAARELLRLLGEEMDS